MPLASQLPRSAAFALFFTKPPGSHGGRGRGRAVRTFTCSRFTDDRSYCLCAGRRVGVLKAERSPHVGLPGSPCHGGKPPVPDRRHCVFSTVFGESFRDGQSIIF